MSNVELVKESAPGKAEIISQLVLKGDLSSLTAAQRVNYYNQMCERIGLDPMTQPFSLLSLQGKVVLYANKSCTEQLRKIHQVSVTEVVPSQVGDVYVVTVKGSDATGRTDGATGAVTIANLKGDALANALMKAETKAKRRFTLSICGLGMLDETEIETIPGAREVSITSPQLTVDAPAAAPTEESPGEWMLVMDGDGVPMKAPQAYWAKRGNKPAQQTALVEKFGPANAYKVEKDDATGNWYVWRQGEAKGDGKEWTPEMETNAEPLSPALENKEAKA